MAAPIGYHATPDGVFTFYDTPSGILAEVPGEKARFSVALPTGPFAGLSTAEKVTRLLQSPHFQFAYLAEIKQASFAPIESSRKTWEISIDSPFKILDMWIPRSDGRISYWEGPRSDQICTWDWKHDRCSTTVFDTSPIQALAELPDGKLIVGDAKGRLYTSKGEWFNTGLSKPISKITRLGNSLLAVELEGELLILDTNTQKCIQRISDPSTFVIASNQVLKVKDRGVEVWEYEPDRHCYNPSQRSFIKLEVVHIERVANTIVALLSNNGETFALWDLETNKHHIHTEKDLWTKLHGSCDIRPVVLNTETIVTESPGNTTRCSFLFKGKISFGPLW